jgi:hypothetical protein
MKRNNFPGFVAERSLENDHKTYSAALSVSQHSQVIPQMRISCVVSALGEYRWCLSAGGGGFCTFVFNRNLWECGLGG